MQGFAIVAHDSTPEHGAARDRDVDPASMDWVEWHRRYDDPASSLNRRLAVVQELLADALDALPPGERTLLSVCAGDGRDVLGVLPTHPRARDMRATLVEQDPRLASRATASAHAAGLAQVTVTTGDAGLASCYESARPVDVLLMCGVFGNVNATDLRRTIEALPDVLGPAGAVLWTRHRGPPDQTPQIRQWFSAAGLEELAFVEVPGSLASVGHHRLTAPPRGAPLPPRLFAFVGDGSGAHL